MLTFFSVEKQPAAPKQKTGTARLYHEGSKNYGLIDFKGFLQSDGDPLFVYKVFDNTSKPALKNPCSGFDTGIDFDKYYAYLGGFLGDYYRIDYGSARTYEYLLVPPTHDQAKTHNTWRLNMWFPTYKDQALGTWKVVVIAIHRKLASLP
ncbi:MAG: hypothetical protein R3B47_07355 [Bacteroidia bacterium]